MHDDAPQPVNTIGWATYFATLSATGRFQGGGGICVRKSGPVPTITAQLGGFIRITADSLDHAQTLLTGNPVYEAGGTVELRELPRTN